MADDTIRVYDASSKTYIQTQRVEKSPQQWKTQLAAVAYNVMREQGTAVEPRGNAGEFRRLMAVDPDFSRADRDIFSRQSDNSFHPHLIRSTGWRVRDSIETEHNQVSAFRFSKTVGEFIDEYVIAR